MILSTHNDYRSATQHSTANAFFRASHPLSLEEVNQRTRLKPTLTVLRENSHQKSLAVLKTASNQTIDTFFTAIGDGQLAVIQHRLARYPDLVYVSWDFRDVTHTVFDRTSAFQYAWWAGDMPLCQLILTYLPHTVAAEQIHTWLNSRTAIKPDAPASDSGLFELTPTLRAYRHYCDFCLNHSSAPTAEKTARWHQQVGDKQSRWPAWLRYQFTEVGREATWPQMAVNQTYSRQPSERYHQWNAEIASGKAFYRNRARQACAIPYLGSYGDYPLDYWNLETVQRQLRHHRRQLRQVFRELADEG